MNDESEAYHLADIEECRGSSYREPYTYKGERYRVRSLNNSIEAPKRRNAKAKVGDKAIARYVASNSRKSPTSRSSVP